MAYIVIIIMKVRKYLAKTDEDSSHGLEVECFVAVEYEHESAELVS